MYTAAPAARTPRHRLLAAVMASAMVNSLQSAQRVTQPLNVAGSNEPAVDAEDSAHLSPRVTIAAGITKPNANQYPNGDGVTVDLSLATVDVNSGIGKKPDAKKGQIDGLGIIRPVLQADVRPNLVGELDFNGGGFGCLAPGHGHDSDETIVAINAAGLRRHEAALFH